MLLRTEKCPSPAMFMGASENQEIFSDEIRRSSDISFNIKLFSLSFEIDGTYLDFCLCTRAWVKYKNTEASTPD